MKITLNVDDALLDRVVDSTGAKTKTAAIDFALREVDRRTELTKVLARGSGISGEELATLFDPASDPAVMRVAEDPADYKID
ncbi:MAG TPA: type II toxin-antitoxin system VapB family antitoxin [Opitutales bacterium]|nr:type II toxin-antitoxin system VapB family antitoxin [Opitutales bacterium]